MPEILPFAAFPDPKDGATEVSSRKVTLRWVSGRNGVTHLVRLGIAGSPGSVVVTENHAVEIQDLKSAMRYCWSVDEVTETDTVRGKIWTFRTAGDR